MLLLKIGPELINLDAVTRVAFREEADGLDVHFAGGTSLWLGGPAAAAFQEELVALHDARLLVIRNRPEAGGGNGNGRVPQRREFLRTPADGHGGGAVQAGHGHAQGAGTAVTLGGVPGYKPDAGAQPLRAPERRADQPEPPRRRRARSGGAAA